MLQSLLSSLLSFTAWTGGATASRRNRKDSTCLKSSTAPPAPINSYKLVIFPTKSNPKAHNSLNCISFLTQPHPTQQKIAVVRAHPDCSESNQLSSFYWAGGDPRDGPCCDWDSNKPFGVIHGEYFRGRGCTLRWSDSNLKGVSCAQPHVQGNESRTNGRNRACLSS